MDLNEMLVFARVAQTGSFTAAAGDLGMPKSTVSRKVTELETRLKARLLNRTTRKVSLTDVGRTYYDYCARIVGEIEDAEGAVSNLQEVPRGFPPARIEIYLARGGEHAAIEVSCAGTLVADDAGELRAEGLDHSPWVGRGLTGLIEFPAFQIPPGTRRGIVPDPASEAFERAMAEYAPLIEAELSRLDRERQSTTSRQLLTELRRALR